MAPDKDNSTCREERAALWAQGRTITFSVFVFLVSSSCHRTSAVFSQGDYVAFTVLVTLQNKRFIRQMCQDERKWL